jgi:hypothetical protein
VKVTIFLGLLYLIDQKSENPLGRWQLMWVIDHEFAASCFAGMLEFAKLINQKRFSGRAYIDGQNVEREFYEKVLKLADLVCDGQLKTDISNLSFESHSHWHLGYAAQIIPLNTSEDADRSYLERLFFLFFQALNVRDARQSDYSNSIRMEFELRDYFAEYLLNQDGSYSQRFFFDILDKVFNIVDGINHEARKFIEELLKHLVIVQDKLNTEVFWDLLRILENRVKQTEKPKFVQYLFLSNPWWDGDADDWIPLKNKKQYYQNLIVTLGQYDIKSVIRLLSGIGTKNLLPDGIMWLETIFTSFPESIQKLTDSDTFFYSEKLIQRVYNLYLREVKSNNGIKKSFLSFLDKMINAVSSLAFIIRERVVSV